MSKKSKRLILIIAEWIIIAALAVIAYMGFSFVKEYKRETTGTEPSVKVVIKEGDGIRNIAETLIDSGVIKYKYTFYIKAVEEGYNGRFQPGEYYVSENMGITDIMEALCYVPKHEDVVQTARFTIPEGYSIEMMGARLEKNGFCKAEEFYKAADRTDYDFDFLKELRDSEEKKGKYALQGFLFPDTYEVYADATAEDIVIRMLEGFESHLKDIEGKSEDYSLYELVTMASIIEREAKLDEERPIISGVIYNRLKKGMKLQMCPTVLYVITEGMYDVNQVLYTDLEVDDPYNTYVYDGLPEGPICCPGLASLKAAAEPAEHDFYFYHTDDEEKGNHIFTKTFEEHVDTRIKK